MNLDAIALLVITIAATAILFGVHTVVKALYDASADLEAEWQRRKDATLDVDWWAL
jgi:hypothetical protein